MYVTEEYISSGTQGSIYGVRGNEDYVIKKIMLNNPRAVDYNLASAIHEYIFTSTDSPHLIKHKDVWYDDTPRDRSLNFLLPRGSNVVRGLKFIHRDNRVAKQSFILRECIAILQELYSNGFAHLDIKPDNMILLDGKIVLIDGGHCVVTDRLSANCTAMCTHWYRSPEAHNDKEMYGREIHHVDVWAMGATLYTLIEGRPLYPGETDEDSYERIMTTPLVFRHALPDAQRIITRCLQKSVADRADVFELSTLLGESFVPRNHVYDDVSEKWLRQDIRVPHSRTYPDTITSIAKDVNSAYEKSIPSAYHKDPMVMKKITGFHELLVDRLTLACDASGNEDIKRHAEGILLLLLAALSNDLMYLCYEERIDEAVEALLKHGREFVIPTSKNWAGFDTWENL